MAGVKGRSGGARPGAGRKPNSPGHVRVPHRAATMRVEQEDVPCCVYVIYEIDEPTVCKIGVASDIASRLSQLQVANWRPLKVGHVCFLPSKSVAHAVERQTHQALSALHFRGEWFKVSHDRAAREVDLAADQLRAAFTAATVQMVSVQHG